MRSERVRRAIGVTTMCTTMLPMLAAAQQRPERFERREQPVIVPPTVFHSQQSANLPTAQTISKGEWLFEISHRFFPPVSEGLEALWGLDGPVANRLGLAYAVADRAMVGIVRTNVDDNIELNAKGRLFEGGSESVPIMIGLMGGLAWNMSASGGSGADDNESQAYAQVMVNALIGGRLGVGLAPTFLKNPRIQDTKSETTFVLGIHGQAYLSEQVSLLGEWIISEHRTDLEHDSGTLGVELETGGHFFKIVLTNQYRMNPTQVLGGTPYQFSPKHWRLGFNVTRLLTL